MNYWFIVIVVWILGSIISYWAFISKWDNSRFEKIWLTCVWPVLIPLRAIHYLYNKF